MDWAGGQFKCELSHYISTALLATLQGLNLFWLYYILRIAYRFVFLNALEDDRSDNDDNEFAEEQKRAAARSGAESAPAPRVLVNGENLNGDGHATATGTQKSGLTNRKENVRKT